MPEFSQEATLAEVTNTQRLLAGLPPPKEKVIVSVYSFDDQTGQHKPSDLPQYSRAVTQGGLALVKKALLDAGNHSWFRVLERGGLDHVLKEREIIRAMRSQYKPADGKDYSPIAPMLYGGVLLEGGIVAYESNTITGGLGARYLGIGGSTSYRQDIVTVSIRVVSVATGEVLLSTLITKTIFSAEAQAGAFRYVSFDRLLETEAGVTKNEPPQVAVRQAIELAVYSLVMDGSAKGYWRFRDANRGKSEYARYQKMFRNSLLGEKESPSPEPVDCRFSTKGAAPTSPASGYYLQVAALEASNQSNPEYLDKLQNRGLPLALQRTQIGDSVFCRVLVGPYLNVSQAAQEKAKIAAVAAGILPAAGEPLVRKY